MLSNPLIARNCMEVGSARPKKWQVICSSDERLIDMPKQKFDLTQGQKPLHVMAKICLPVCILNGVRKVGMSHMRPRNFFTVFAALFLSMLSSNGATSSISFNLDEPSLTSAGVFQPDGTLVRTLWSKIYYPVAGSYSAVWDGLDDTSNAVPAGTYQVKLLQHNAQYVWDGAVGNTSAEIAGPTVHSAFYPMQDMAISGTNAFYDTGYNEGKYDFCSFSTSDPQHATAKWGPGGIAANIYDRSWNWVAADNARVYFACNSMLSTGTSTNLNAGCVVSYNIGSTTSGFAGALTVTNGSNISFPGIYVGTQAGLSGLAVQQNGNLLAVSVAPDNEVYLFDKTLGIPLSQFSVNSPGRLTFSSDGRLWVISGGSVICYTNLGLAPAATVTLGNLSNPLDVAVNPTNNDIVLVADGGASQQVKAFSGSGSSLWTYGLAGGYQSNGPSVATNKFWFYNGQAEATFLCFAPDGSFWIGDGGNHRVLHFQDQGNYIDEIMWQPTSYKTCVDQNNPSRVFNQFLEFSVDYTKPLQQSWTLIKNWQANVPANYLPSDQGLYSVTTLTNGRTYALIENTSLQFSPGELCELPSNNVLRFTGIMPLLNSTNSWITLGADGSARSIIKGSADWYLASLQGFDSSNNPVWNPPALLASASQDPTDPVVRCCSFGIPRVTISTNNVVISFDQSLNDGWHLGGVKVGGTNWLWKASPSMNLNGRGAYEISNGVTYAGNSMQAVDRNVIYGYHGEFFRSQGQASQHMHYYDDGLFVGQFGEASVGHSAYEGALAAFAGNGHCPTLVKTTNGDYYLWVNDESAHGPQRWHFINARNIREQMGAGTLGQTIVLTNPAVGFPVGVSAVPENQSAALSWLPVLGATSYNIRYSALNGGPYDTIAGTVSATNYLAIGLRNSQAYYFAVTATVGGVEGIPSEQVKVFPFDPSQVVQCVGSISEGGQSTPIMDVSSARVGSNQPSLIGSEHLTGLLTPQTLVNYGYGNLANLFIGTKGYVIYDWGGETANLTNLSPAFSVTNLSGWTDLPYLSRQFNVDGITGTNWGLSTSSLGTMNIAVSDTNFHYLTVVSPAKFNDARKFTMSITSTNGAAAQISINESVGYSHIFQFLFKGNIALQANAQGGSGGIVQAIFLDTIPNPVPAAAPVSLPTPTGLHFIK
jgi:hypothetical protein